MPPQERDNEEIVSVLDGRLARWVEVLTRCGLAPERPAAA